MTINKKDLILFILALAFMVMCLLLINKCKQNEPYIEPIKPIDTLKPLQFDSVYFNSIDSAEAVFDSLIQNWHRLQAMEVLSK